MTGTESAKVKARVAREKKTLMAMVALYCGHNHQGGMPLCDDCSDVIKYSDARIDDCPFIDEKPTCLNCKVHCFDESRREKIRSIMRYSGPRMIYHHPVLFILHLADGRRKK